jgi:hypothetical protein
MEVMDTRIMTMITPEAESRTILRTTVEVESRIIRKKSVMPQGVEEAEVGEGDLVEITS